MKDKSSEEVENALRMRGAKVSRAVRCKVKMEGKWKSVGATRWIITRKGVR